MTNLLTTNSHIYEEVLADLRKKIKDLEPTPLLSRKFVSVDKRKANETTDGTNDVSDKSSHVSGTLEKQNGAVRVMQWNVLAHGLCLGSDGFALTPKPALEWQRRGLQMSEELITYKPDICCLQEVDNFQTFCKLLEPLGLTGLFCPKADSPCLYQPGNCGPDGCAIFWRNSLFKMTKFENIILQLDDGTSCNQVALFVWLQGLSGSSASGKEILVVSTHLKSKLGWSELRYQQGKFIEKKIQQVAEGRPVLLCGDFNADPDEPVINVMKSSNLSLQSAYTLLDKTGQEPPYTTWKFRRNKDGSLLEACHTIDYVFFSNEKVKCLQLLEFPTGEEMGDVRLPSFAYPSDHLSLVCDFKFDVSAE